MTVVHEWIMADKWDISAMTFVPLMQEINIYLLECWAPYDR